MYDPRRVIQPLNNLHPKPDSTVPSPPADKVEAANVAPDTLADLASSEISLDLQGLIDDAHFGADAEIFGDLIDQGGGHHGGHNGGGHHGHGHGGHKRDFVRLSPVNSLGSSAHSSPGDHHHQPQDSPPSFNNYRSSLAYLPGSVHGASFATPTSNNLDLPSITTLSNAVHVKLEPSEIDQQLKRQIHHNNNNNNNNGQNNNTYVSSTTHVTAMAAAAAYAMNNNGQQRTLTAQPPAASSLKTFTPSPGLKYPSMPGTPASTSSKKRSDRNSDEYRRRRERNNVAVRKSREKAKVRTRDTEDRVKILARENERLQKKVELLQEELAVLRSLFSNVGVLPDHIHRELSKHIDNFQQQHNAMACM
jgi:hypothetical protein